MKKIIIKIIELLFIIACFVVCGTFLYKTTNKIKKEKLDTTYIWNIDYSNIQVKEGSKETELKEENGTFQLDITLEKPKEFYEVTMDIENKGTADAYISDIKEKVESTDDVLKRQITYLDGTEIKKGDELLSGAKATIKIRIEYPETKKKIYKKLNLILEYKIEYKALT